MSNSSNKKAKFIIPGLYEHYGLNFRLLELMQERPEYFRENAEIGAVYGNFQFCIFDGGRIFNGYRQTCREEIEKIVHTYNDVFNVPVRLIFTNPNVPETSFRNRFGQVILDICHNGKNEIVVNDSKFEAYLRENYPNFGYISSTTKCLNTPDQLKAELENNYKMVCLDYNLNHNKKVLEDVPVELKGKYEFLVNAICPPGCPNRKEHYRLNGLFSLSYGKNYTMSNCPIVYDTLHPEQWKSPNNISPEEIYQTYVPQGFENFKLEGRSLGFTENICNYVRYLVKPEYQLEVIALLYKEEPSITKAINNDKLVIQTTY